MRLLGRYLPDQKWQNECKMAPKEGCPPTSAPVASSRNLKKSLNYLNYSLNK